MDVGIDSFAYHRYFGETTRFEQPLAQRWTTEDFLDRAKALGVSEVALQTIYLPSLGDAGLAGLAGALRERGLRAVLSWGHPDGLKGGLAPDRVGELLQAMRAAAALGSPLVRLVCGNHFTFTTPADDRIARLTPMLRDLADEAAALGLVLAIENHADFRMRDLVQLVEGVGSDRLGICFDTGNAVRVGDDVLDAARLAAPFVKMVHLKDMIVRAEDHGDPTAWWPSVPVGRGAFDIHGFVDVLAAGGFDGTLYVELANMRPEWADEDAAVAESIAWTRALLAGKGWLRRADSRDPTV
jgi:3-oxoisoapionate decarboxylase